LFHKWRGLVIEIEGIKVLIAFIHESQMHIFLKIIWKVAE